MTKPSSPSRVPVDREKWSESSKRSYTYYSHPPEYRDYHYKCSSCGQPSVFTAEAQRNAYEVRKAYIWQSRTLCTDCFRECMRIERDLRKCAEDWKSDRSVLQQNTEFLRRWLTLLEDHVKYGGRADAGNIHMLRHLLGERNE